MALEADRQAGQAIARAAGNLLGAPFRLHGREPASGLDCVGLVMAALRACSRPVPRLPPYRLRQLRTTLPQELVWASGYRPAQGYPAPGDLLLMRPGPAQLHLAIVGLGTCAIHADASLGRVVQTPLPLPWPIAGHWHPIELD